MDLLSFLDVVKKQNCSLGIQISGYILTEYPHERGIKIAKITWSASSCSVEGKFFGRKGRKSVPLRISWQSYV
jgi:hypothetical protein